MELDGEQHFPVSRLCMKRVCSRFRICLERLGPELRDDVLLCTKVLQFNLLLKQDARYNLQDQYNQRCNSSSLNSQLYRRGCFGCLKIHRNSNDFCAKSLSAALTISPKTCLCISLQGSIEICEHISFSTECLLRGLHDFNKLEIRCQIHRLVREVDGNRCAILERTAAYGLRITYHDVLRITIDRRFYLFSALAGTNHTRQGLFDALQTINSAICTHLRTSSPHLFYEELTAECSYGVGDDPNESLFFNTLRQSCALLRDFRFDGAKCIFWLKCLSPECDTCFGLRQLHSDLYPI
jgi:hypothetical protein